jgi:phenylalanyl-tRNA synthetase alpha chain
MGQLSAEERPIIGQLANEIRDELNAGFQERVATIKQQELQKKLQAETIDVTLPGKSFVRGTNHPLTLVIEEAKQIFIGLGFQIAEGPEIETDYYNFEALNLPKDHPARDMQDTFYISPDIVLRTHTSPVQVRTMEKLKPEVPVKIICPGKVYRKDDDATHSPMFHQIEGLVIDKGIRMSDLKGILLAFVQQMFGSDRKIRIRPSYFPFTEPSAEVDVSCGICGGSGCKSCANTGWLEILGSGMVHPNVLRYGGYDPNEVTGFAFGMGVERIAMLKYGINDMRLLFENDIRFLQQF